MAKSVFTRSRKRTRRPVRFKFRKGLTLEVALLYALQAGGWSGERSFRGFVYDTVTGEVTIP